MKEMIKRITSVTLVLALTMASACGGIRIHCVTPEEKVSKAAEAKGIYIKDIAISYASSKEEAQKELGDEYIILENKVGRSWVGYTTTDDPDKAIRDIKVQTMTGKYSVSDYEELLKNHKEVIKGQVDTFVPALIEFTKNYDSGLDAAAIIYKNLNCFYEDDSEMALGEYLVEQGHRLISDLNDASAREKLEKIYVEANTDLIQEMENIITQGIDTTVREKGTWMSRMSELGPHGLIDLYKNSFKNLKTDSAVKKQLEKDYGDDAAMLLKELPAIQSYIREKEGSDVAKAIESGDDSLVDDLSTQVADKESASEPTNDSTIEDITKSLGQSLESIPDTMDFNEDVSVGALVLFLKGIPYGDQTMYDFFMNERIEKSDLYTMAYVLSSGQKSIMGDVGLFSILQGAATGYAEGTEDTNDLVDTIGEKAFSIYDGVDRDVFNGDTALTEDAIKRMQTENDNSSLTSSSSVSGFLAAFAACVGVYCTYRMFKSTITTRGYSKFKITISAESTEAFIKADKSVQKLGKEIEIMSKNDNALRIKMYLKYKDVENFSYDIVGKTPSELERGYKAIVEQIKKENQVTELRLYSKESEQRFLQERKAKLQEKLAVREQVRARGDLVKYGKSRTETIRTVSKGARIGYALGAVAAFAFAGYEIYQMVKKDPSVKYTEIPAKMVSRTYDDDEIRYMTYCVARTKDGKKADLQNWKGKEWIALYITSDDRAGDPVLTSSLISSERNAVSDADYNPVSEFCSLDVYGVSGDNTAYMFFKSGMEAVEEELSEEEKESENADTTAVSGEAAEATTASIFAVSSYIWIILIVVVVIGVGTGTVVYLRKRKHK